MKNLNIDDTVFRVIDFNTVVKVLYNCDDIDIRNDLLTYVYRAVKILGEEVEYIQVPVTIKGTYCPINNKADFTYIL